ncbi:MAG: PD-(D/E)XK nuclease domain-containing protein [Kiritimatiellae bacterium]|nr:PD-(D/E)XK nuclease domain-containing protein [Kiritimatiellia bacterium]
MRQTSTRSRLYSLDFPNREVRESFLHDLAPVYSGLREDQAGSAQIAAITALYDHDVPKFVKALKTFFSNIPYSLTDRQNEQMWQTIVYVILRLIGVSAQGEVQTNDGRIDLVAKTPDDIYIVEFKLDRPAAEAMEQIKGKEYAGKYALSGKRITLIGISFSAEKRTIVEELVEELSESFPISAKNCCE